MNKHEYMLLAISNECYKYRAWVFSLFSICEINKDDDTPYVLRRGKKTYYFIDPTSKEEIELTDTSIKEPAFKFTEATKLKSGDVVNLKKSIDTTYGILLSNCIILIHSFKDKIPYMNKEIDIGEIEGNISKRLTTDLKHQTKDSFKPDNPIYISEYLNFIDASLSLEGYSQLCVPTATEKSMTRSPETVALRDKLLKENSDKLDNPVVVSKIEAEIIKSDTDWIKGDLSEGFFYKKDMIAAKRKKAHFMQGYETGFGESGTITKSLSEGWDVKNMPIMVNSLREGSYSRGKMTQLGGYATKTINRIFQNVTLSDNDCGTTLGWVRTITKDNSKSLVGFYYLNNDRSSDTTTLITNENIKALVGKTVVVRSPQFCKSPKTTFCKYCMGVANSENQNALGAHAAAATSQMMQIEMSTMHSKELKSASYDIETTID